MMDIDNTSEEEARNQQFEQNKKDAMLSLSVKAAKLHGFVLSEMQGGPITEKMVRQIRYWLTEKFSSPLKVSRQRIHNSNHPYATYSVAVTKPFSKLG